MKPLGATALMTLLGLLTAAIVVAPILLFEHYAAGSCKVIRPHTIMFFLVLPVPAILIGSAASSGYYIGARIAHYRLGKILLINLCLFSTVLFLAIYLLEYVFIFTAHGIIPEDMGFGEFLYRDWFQSSIELRTKSGRGGRIVDSQLLGAVLRLVLLGGFVFGGVGAFWSIRWLPYCERCRQFMKTRTKQVRYPGDGRAVESIINSMQALRKEMDDGLLENLLVNHAGFTKERNLGQSRWRSILWHKECAGCGTDCLEHRGYRYGRLGWKDHGETSQVYPSQQIQLKP